MHTSNVRSDVTRTSLNKETESCESAPGAASHFEVSNDSRAHHGLPVSSDDTATTMGLSLAVLTNPRPNLSDTIPPARKAYAQEGDAVNQKLRQRQTG